MLLTLLSVFSYVSEYLVSAYAPGSALESLREPLNAFQLDRERSFPTLYVSTLWLLCAVLLAVAAFASRAAGGRYTRHWGALAVIFIFLFSDEILQIHEEISPLVRGLLGTTGFLYRRGLYQP